MTATELEKVVREGLSRNGLWELVDRHKSQFLEFPDGLFAEIVLVDAAKLEDTEVVLQEIRQSLKRQGSELDAIVRANWTIESIGDPSPARASSGGIRAAWAFPVKLVCGGAAAQVEVDVTYSALLEIRNRLVGASESGDEKSIMKDVVREFLNLELRLGGASYWDPIRYPQKELNEAALSYLLIHGMVGKG